jgi:hypothetical protein
MIFMVASTQPALANGRYKNHFKAPPGPFFMRGCAKQFYSDLICPAEK